MPKTLGYMITWTTYGTWLQGDERGFVKEGTIYAASPALAESNQQSLKSDPIKLSPVHCQIVRNAILEKANGLHQQIHALSVSSNHEHILAEYVAMPIGLVVRHYKGCAQAALRKVGLASRIWTKGFDKRYCFDQQTLQNRINYVKSHDKGSRNI